MHHPPGRQPIERVQDRKGVFMRLWGYLRQSSWWLLLSMILMLFSTVASLVAGYLTRPLINDYILPGNFSGLFWMLLVMAVLFLGGVVTGYVKDRMLLRISQRTVHQMREELFSKMQKLPLRYFDTNSHGDLMSRYTNDMEQVSSTLRDAMSQLIGNTLTFLGLLVSMLLISPLLTGITLLMIPLLLLVMGQILKRSRRYYAKRQESLGALNGFIEERIDGQKVVKVFSREERLKAEFAVLNGEQRKSATQAEIFGSIAMPLVQNMNLINFAFTAAIGGFLAVAGSLDLGGLAVFLTYSRQFAQPLNQISSQLSTLQSALAGAERVFQMMDEPFESVEEQIEPVGISGNVEFRHVWFSYQQGEPVLKDVNLQVIKGQKVALVGSTGAGKTTVINLLTRFYEVEQGSILIDGADIRTRDLFSLRNGLGLVLQDTHLFTGTVMENIRYGNLEATDESCRAAAYLVYADSFISRLPQGYDTPLTADGMNLSQGQRQLIGIARTAVKNPPILILDEATSSIDTRTERLIQRGMDKLMAGRTSFVIAHRISTIVSADLICVIEGGEIVEMGSHQELLALKGRYAALYQGQFRTE